MSSKSKGGKGGRHIFRKTDLIKLINFSIFTEENSFFLFYRMERTEISVLSVLRDLLTSSL